MVELVLGDCLQILPTMPAQSVHAIITDLPYGTTQCAWDEVIPFAPMWEQVKRVLKPRGVFVTTASQPFTSKLVMSNPEWFKYAWTWEKSRNSNPFLAKFQPLRVTEDVCVFAPRSHTYNPQMEKGTPYKVSDLSGGRIASDGKAHMAGFIGDERDTRYPKNIIRIPNPSWEFGKHPTQKPVALYEYLILTYTNPGETVLDICAGSGTTGVACVKTGRAFIGIEKDPTYCAIAQKRIAAAQMQPMLEGV